MEDENTICKILPNPRDLLVFLTVIRKLSFAAAAEELGQSPAYISKRIGVLEAKLSEQFPELEVRLEVFDRAVDIIQEGFDLEISLLSKS